MGAFEFRARGLQPEVHEENNLPEAEDEVDETEGMEVPMALGEFEGGRDLDDQAVKYELGAAIPDRIRINDVELAAESPLRSLRAACAFYKVGQSGGKRKCFGRLVEHQGTLELMRARDSTASAEAALTRRPIEQSVAKAPTAEEKRNHELTHIPYAPWCECCVKHRARQDQHRRSGGAREAGPAISFDFAYTRPSGIGPLGEPEEDGAQEGVADDESGWLLCVPKQATSWAYH